MDHHKLSPSSWGRIERCPGSVALTEDAPKVEAGAGADHGTRIHAAALEGIGYNDLNEYDRTFVDKWKRFIAEEVRVISGELGDPLVWKEERIIAWSGRKPVTYGTMDEIHYYRGIYGAPVVRIYDLKTHPTGELPEHMTMMQGLIYSMGALQRFPDAVSATFTAFAPASGKEFLFTLEREKLDEYEAWAGGIADAANAAHELPREELLAGLNPGTEQCRFCPAAGICPAIQTVAEEVSAEVAERGTESLPGVRETAGRTEITAAKEFAKFYARLELAARAVDATKKGIKELMATADSDFLELKTKAGRKKFADDPKNKSALPNKIARILTVDDFKDAATVSVSRLRKIFIERRTEAGDITAKDAGKEFDELVADMIEQSAPSAHIGWQSGARKKLVSEV